MDTSNLPSKLFETLTQHIPPDVTWMPLVGTIIAMAAGVVFLVKGAKLAPVLAAVVFAVLGGLGGSLLVRVLPVPLWLPIVLCGAVGAVLGVALFRIWFALLVGGCLAVAALSVYGQQVLHDPLNEYLSRGYDEANGLVTLLEPGEVAVHEPTLRGELVGLWQYLGERVPNFQASFAVIVLTAGLAGLVFGLALPKTARAFWAASMGVGLALPAVQALLLAYWPPGAIWLTRWGLIIGALLWGGSLVYNLADMVERRPEKAIVQDAEAAKA